MDDAPTRSMPQQPPHDSLEDSVLRATVSFESTDGQSVGGFAVAENAGPAPTVLGRYELQECVGRGGFGEVWKAYDPHLQRHVALKFPRGDRQFTSQAYAKFLDEGRKLAHVAECDGIVTVYDAGETDGVVYIVSEFIAGGSLKDRMNDGPLSVVEAVELVTEIAKSLHAAHLKGLVHRDIKPGNILLKNGTRPVIADFGLAVTEREQLHEPYYTVGTFAYVSPEQIATGSRMANPQADIYSLGVVLYELLTGRLPFISESVRDYKQQLLHRPPRPPRTVNDTIPPELERIVLRCLQKEPTERYTTAADLARELETTLKTAPAAQMGDSAEAASRRSLWRWIFAGCLLAAVVLLAGWSLGWRNDASNKEPGGNPVGSSTAKPKDDFVYQDWSNDELVPKRLYRLLRIVPETLEGPKPGAVGNHFIKNSETLQVSFRGAGLFKFGTLHRPSYTLRVNVRHNGIWQGQVGVFLGVGDTDSAKPGRISGQMIVISPNTGRDARRFPLMAIRYRVGPKYSRSYPSDKVAYSQKLPGVPLGSKQALELEVKDGWLTGVRWGTHDLIVLRSDDLNGCFKPQDYRGSFGVFSAAVGGVDFQNATIIIANE